MAEVKRRRRAAAPGIAPSEPERDILDQYLYEVSTYPLLKGNEEIEVARKIRAGPAFVSIISSQPSLNSQPHGQPDAGAETGAVIQVSVLAILFVEQVVDIEVEAVVAFSIKERPHTEVDDNIFAILDGT